ncbi:hypothetical protein BT63DRAFT_451974 [Microthyrium microscopicum]|uniref:Inositol-pentakisphosphate 2-kinase n=1 Tax=Microthyrium microscopicum TaxID=703497 RepID=A0A6A6UNQ6_9PEZI|nr:hypothetical protein BT63DRAFT_451974 [Microthyrium microscopicum]
MSIPVLEKFYEVPTPSVIASVHEVERPRGGLRLGEAQENSEDVVQVELRYIAEGAANVIFSIEILGHAGKSKEDISPLCQRLEGMLLRLRKGSQALPNIQENPTVPPPPFVPAQEIVKFINERLPWSLTQSFMVVHTLIQIQPEVLQLCNALLMTLEATNKRISKRRGWYLSAEETHGILVTDMRPQKEGDITIEFKPKWLEQSPMAPDGARRCRTCAWHVKNGVKASKRYCPLAIASLNRPQKRAHIAKFVPKADSLPDGWDYETVLNEFTSYFCDIDSGLQLLNRLRAAQKEYDPDGALSAIGISDDNYSPEPTPELLELVDSALQDSHNHGFLRLACAMTLRDLIIFARLSKAKTVDAVCIEGRIADLDFKKVEAEKLLKWALDEATLLRGGYYMGTESRSDSDTATKGDICFLWQQT